MDFVYGVLFGLLAVLCVTINFLFFSSYIGMRTKVLLLKRGRKAREGGVEDDFRQREEGE